MWLLLACAAPDDKPSGDDSGRPDTADTGADDTGRTDTSETGTTPACDTVPTFEDGLAPTRELHVDTRAGSGGDGSSDRPFSDLEAAARAAGPGDAIVVHAGTYDGGAWIEDLRGTESAPIWLGGAAGEEKPVLHGGGEAIHLSRPAWVVLHDLVVRETTDNGVNIDDGGLYDDETAAHHVVVRGLEISDVGGDGNQDCLKLSGLNDFFVLDNTFARCGGGGSGSGVDHVGCHHGVLARNHFETMSGNAIQAKGGSEDLDILRNVVEDGGERAFNLGGSSGYEYFRPPLSTSGANAEARDLRAVANVIVGGITPVAYVGCVGCVFAHNTVVDPEMWVLRILQETVSGDGYTFEPSSDGVFADNVVWYSRERLSTWANVGPDTDPDSFTFRNDLWYAHDAPARSEPELPVAETGAIIGEDPLFVDGYHLDPTSPAVGSGVRLDTTPAGDHDGRCWEDPPSIGAYEGG